MSRMHGFFVALVVLFGAFSAFAGEGKPMLPYGEIYSGSKNETVEVGYFKDSQDALIRVKGVNHEWDNKVINVTYHTAGQGKDFVTKVDGKDYTLLVLRPSVTELHMPGYSANPTRLYFDKNASQEARPLHLRTAYEQQAGK